MDINKSLNEAKAYLQDVLGLENWKEQQWQAAGQLPFFLQDLYAFFLVDLFGKSCLFMLSRSRDGGTPAVVRKHWQAVGKHFAGDVIYLVASITSFNRKRLIEQGVPFLVPGNQLYLPMLGMDLRERFKNSTREDKAHVSAAAQALVIREILLKDCSEVSAKELAARLGYSTMSMSRAIKELEDKQLVEAVKVGREKRLYFKEYGRQLWEAALPALQTPVKKRVRVIKGRWINEVGAMLAGEAAIVRYTMLAGPDEGVWALNASEWPGLKKLLHIEELENAAANTAKAMRYESDIVQVELWSYSPAVVDHLWEGENKRIVDPLSLWLSIENSEDERLEMARDSLLELVWSKLPW